MMKRALLGATNRIRITTRLIPVVVGGLALVAVMHWLGQDPDRVGVESKPSSARGPRSNGGDGDGSLDRNPASGTVPHAILDRVPRDPWRNRDRSRIGESAEPAWPGPLGLRQSVRAALSLQDSIVQSEVFEALADSVADDAIPELMQRLQGDVLNSEFALHLVDRWIRDDPEAVGDWLPGLTDDEARAMLQRRLVVYWAENDSQRAVQWVLGSPERHREAGLALLGMELARREPVFSLQLARLMEPGPSQDTLVRHAVSQWASQDAEQAAAWVSQFSSPELKQSAAAVVSVAWSESDPEAAARFAVDSMAWGKRQADALVGIVQRWAQHEPERAAQWIQGFPEGSAKEGAVENLVQQWARSSPDDARQWVQTLQASASRDRGFQALEVATRLRTPRFADEGRSD